MKIRLLCVGKPKDPLTAPLHDRYGERIRRLGVPYEGLFVAETPLGGRYSDRHVREREADSIRDSLPRKGQTVALDPDGTMFSSAELAQRLQRWGNPSVTFVLGGPLGLDSKLIAECDEAWSLSPLTFPHEIARVLVAEQLYRALTIHAGIPYHK